MLHIAPLTSRIVKEPCVIVVRFQWESLPYILLHLYQFYPLTVVVGLRGTTSYKSQYAAVLSPSHFHYVILKQQ